MRTRGFPGDGRCFDDATHLGCLLAHGDEDQRLHDRIVTAQFGHRAVEARRSHDTDPARKLGYDFHNLCRIGHGAPAGRSAPSSRLASTIARNPSPGWAVTMMISRSAAPSSFQFFTFPAKISASCRLVSVVTVLIGWTANATVVPPI